MVGGRVDTVDDLEVNAILMRTDPFREFDRLEASCSASAPPGLGRPRTHADRRLSRRGVV